MKWLARLVGMVKLKETTSITKIVKNLDLEFTAKLGTVRNCYNSSRWPDKIPRAILPIIKFSFSYRLWPLMLSPTDAQKLC